MFSEETGDGDSEEERDIDGLTPAVLESRYEESVRSDTAGQATSPTTSSPNLNFGYVTRIYSFPSLDNCVSLLMFSLKCKTPSMYLPKKSNGYLINTKQCICSKQY